MGAQWPLVVGRLLVLLPTLPGWSNVTIFDGPPVTADVAADYVTVGYVADDTGGTYVQVQTPDGFRCEETGTVRSQLSSVTGDTDLASVRTRVFALIDQVQAAVRADRRLGVLSPEGTTELDVDVLSLQNSGGAAQSVVFTLHYLTIT